VSEQQITVVDARGLICPMPILRLAQAIRVRAPGEVLHLIGTDPAIHPDVRAWCEATGHALVRLGGSGASYEAWIQKAPG